MKLVFEQLVKIKKDPRLKMTILLDIAALASGYYFFYIYQDIFGLNVPLLSLKSLLAIPLISTLIIPLIHYTIILPDPLQRSPSKNKMVRFFQNELPSLYLLNRCDRCTENKTTCRNYITRKSSAHVKYWLHDIFHGPIEEKNPDIINETFEKGYTCKLMYNTYWILFAFSLFASLTMIVHFLIKSILLKKLIFDLIPLQIISPIIGFTILILICFLNKVDSEKPSGCWHAWREINRIHITWLRKHEEFLNNLICKANNQNKRFIKK